MDTLMGVPVSRVIECIKEGQCPFCGEEYHTVYGVLNHIRSAHPIDGACPVCNTNTKMLTLHMSKKDDLAHMVVYAIYFQNRRSRKLRSVRKELFG